MHNDRLPSRLANHLVGWVLYPSGDLLAQLIMGAEVNWWRALILMLVGGLVYRIEIPAWFRRLDALTFSAQTIARRPWLSSFSRTVDGATDGTRKLNWVGRTAGAMAYFNPLWIARHVFFISLSTCATSPGLTALVQSSLKTGCVSFATNLPLTLAANYAIQTHVPPRARFLASALLTTLLTVKYAVELRFFG